MILKLIHFIPLVGYIKLGRTVRKLELEEHSFSITELISCILVYLYHYYFIYKFILLMNRGFRILISRIEYHYRNGDIFFATLAYVFVATIVARIIIDIMKYALKKD